MQAGGQTVLDHVLRFDRLIERIDADNAEDRAEVFGQVVLATDLDTRADTGTPQSVRVIERLWGDFPLLTWLQRGQTAQ